MVLFPLPPHRNTGDCFGPKVEAEGSSSGSCIENISRYPPARVGRCCDFTAATQERFRQLQAKEAQGGKKLGFWAQQQSALMAANADEKDGYALVDTKQNAGPAGGKGGSAFRGKGGARGGAGFQFQSTRAQLQASNYQEGIVGKVKKNQGGKGDIRGGGQGKDAKGKGKKKGRPFNRNMQQTFRDWSISIKNDWEVVSELSLASFVKLNLDARGVQKTDLTWAGTLHQLNTDYDRVSFRKAKNLPIAHDVAFFNVTSSQDEILGALLQDDESIQVVATDNILACLMAAGRSVYSWDVIVRKMDDKIIFDKRDHSPIDFLSVNETSTEPPVHVSPEAGKDGAPPSMEAELNSPPKLAKEASRVNQNFSQALASQSITQTLDMDHPFMDEEEEKGSAVCYRYRKIVLPGDRKAEHAIKKSDVTICVRTEINAAMGDISKYNSSDAAERPRFVLTKCLNEYKPVSQKNDGLGGKGNNNTNAGLSWEKHLESQQGAVLANELKNNAAKISRWIASAQLADASMIRMGWAIRDPMATNLGHQHKLVACQAQPTAQLSAQISLSEGNCYGILRHLIDLIRAQPDGTYLFVKDPTRPILRLYAVPDGSLSESEEEEEIIEDSDDE